MHFSKITDILGYHNFWRPVNFADMLEILQLLAAKRRILQFFTNIEE